MKRWAAIQYREFYDIPRIFLADDGKQIFLFDCQFDVKKDDYPETYKVYSMTRLSEEDIKGSWESLPSKAERFLGEVRTLEVEFDATRRREVNLEILDKITRVA